MPLDHGKTEWNIHQETRQGLLSLRGPGAIFGFEEFATGYSEMCGIWPPTDASDDFKRASKAIAVTDCLVIEGDVQILTECKLSLYYPIVLKENELADFATAAECTQGSRVSEAYLQAKREKRTWVRQVMDAAHFNPARDFGASKSQGKKKGSSRETFKNRMNQRMLMWVDGIETRVEAGVEEREASWVRSSHRPRSTHRMS